MCAMFIELLLMPALELWSAQQRFDYKYKKFVALTMAMSVVSILVGVIAVVTASMFWINILRRKHFMQ